MFFAVLQTPTDLLVWGLVAHLAADWLFQTDWMAINKVSLRHPASWTHAAVYTLFMALVFPFFVAVLIGLLHLLIDTRAPVRWWMHVVKGASETTPGAAIVEMGVDQVFHAMVIAAASLLLASF